MILPAPVSGSELRSILRECRAWCSFTKMAPPSLSGLCRDLMPALWREGAGAGAATSEAAHFSSGWGHLRGWRFVGLLNLACRYLPGVHGTRYRLCRSPLSLRASRHLATGIG